MKTSLKMILCAISMLFAFNVAAQEEGAVDQRAMMQELMPLMMAARNGEKPDAAKVDELVKKYGHLKKGMGAGALVSVVISSKIANESEEKGLEYADSVINDTSYGNMVRQMAAFAKIQPAVKSGDMAKVEKLLDEAIALDPNSPMASSKDRMLQMYKSQMDGSSAK